MAAAADLAAELLEQIEAIYAERARRLTWLRKKPRRFLELEEYYRDGHIAEFITDWGVTFDPRNIRKKLPVEMPFTLDPKQREWVDFTWQNWQDAEYGGAEKSRDVGLSWLIVGFSCGLSVLFDDMAIGWGSYVGEKVDKRGDMGSLFEKGRNFLAGLPIEFRGGYDPKTCASERRLLFPLTGASIIGEIGDNIGRGNRTAIYFVDETAYLEHDMLVDAALSKTTDCRQDASSVHGMNNTFATRMHDGTSRKFTFHWRDNPRFTEKDYEKFLDTWGPVITAQELDINYQASVEGVVIPAEWVNAAVDAHIKLGIEPTGARQGALDVADEGIDKNAYAVRCGILLEHVEDWSGKGSDIYATTERAFAISDLHGVRSFKYDADGPGAGVRGDAARINKTPMRASKPTVRAVAFRGSSAVLHPDRRFADTEITNKNMFENLKAQAWWDLRRRFRLTYRALKGEPYDPSDIISISSAIECKARLILELSQPQYDQSKSGKLLILKQPKGTKSPNLADAVMMVYAAVAGGVRINPALVAEEL